MKQGEDGGQARRALELARERGLVSRSDLNEESLPGECLSRLAREGLLTRLAPGIYMDAEADLGEHLELAVITKRAPRAVFFGLTALVFHELTTQVARRVEFAIERGTWAPALDWPTARVVRLSGASYSTGIERHGVAGGRERARLLGRQDRRRSLQVPLALRTRRRPRGAQGGVVGGAIHDGGARSLRPRRAASWASCGPIWRCSLDEESGRLRSSALAQSFEEHERELQSLAAALRDRAPPLPDLAERARGRVHPQGRESLLRVDGAVPQADEGRRHAPPRPPDPRRPRRDRSRLRGRGLRRRPALRSSIDRRSPHPQGPAPTGRARHDEGLPRSARGSPCSST